MSVFLVSALTLVNLLLWGVFFIKFKKLFSIDNIMQEFRSGMDNILADTQRQTVFSINLVEEKKRELKAVTAEAERRLNLLKHELSLAQTASAVQKEISSQVAAAKTKRRTPAKTAVEKYRKNTADTPDEDAAYALTGLFAENAQRSLFEEGGQSVTVTTDGDSYGRIPLVKPRIVVSDEPVVLKKDVAAVVREMNDVGRSVEDIASETGRTITEIELMLAIQNTAI